MPAVSRVDRLLQATETLRLAVNRLTFAPPVHTVYNPLDYAAAGHTAYVEAFAQTPKHALFLGMNPGPWGMAQTGVPFGAIPAVRDWMELDFAVEKPACEHPKRPVTGLACPRVEVSGRRLWLELFAAQWGSAKAFFAQHYVANYCPLVFMAESGANVTPDKLPAAERVPLEAACDAHLAAVIEILEPELVIGVGGFAEKCARRVIQATGGSAKVATILHPSPASPLANKLWPERPREQLAALGVGPV